MKRHLNEAAYGRLAERLARLLEAGVPLLEALAHLLKRGTRQERSLLAEIDTRLRAGRMFSQVLTDEQAPLIMRALVEVGEHNGDLAGSLLRCSEYCAERTQWQRESRQALIYPVLVCTVLLLVSLFLFVVVIPRFALLYAGMGLQVTGGTRVLIQMADVAPEGMGGFIGAVVLVVLAMRRFGVPDEMHNLWMRVPVVRRWELLDRTHEWTATLGLLLDGGLPLLAALDVQGQLPIKQENRRICARVRERVLLGMKMADALQTEPLDDLLLLTVQVAELTGDLPRALLTVEKELAIARKQWMTVMLKALEPALMIAAGALVGLVSLFMLWPMLDLLKAI